MPSPYYLGVDLGGTNIQCGLVQGGKVLARDGAKTKASEGSDAVIARLAKLCDKVCDSGGVKRAQVKGLGIGAPGAVDIDKGVVLKAGNLGWDNFPLAKVLEKELKLPVVVDNDVNVAAWGEHQAGAGKGHRDLFAIWVGTGVGGGLILDNRLFHGVHHTAGEVGHTLLRADGGLGRRTVEDLASRTNMVNLLVQLIEGGHKSVIPELVGGDLSRIRSKILAQALKKDDPLTVEVVRQAATYIGTSIAGMVTMLSLPCVVVGGGATEALGKRWMDWVRAAFDRHVFPQELRRCVLVPSALNDNAGVVGAAMLAAAIKG